MNSSKPNWSKSKKLCGSCALAPSVHCSGCYLSHCHMNQQAVDRIMKPKPATPNQNFSLVLDWWQAQCSSIYNCVTTFPQVSQQYASKPLFQPRLRSAAISGKPFLQARVSHHLSYFPWKQAIAEFGWIPQKLWKRQQCHIYAQIFRRREGYVLDQN